jgi:hypothetical protein
MKGQACQNYCKKFPPINSKMFTLPTANAFKQRYPAFETQHLLY